MFGPFNHWSELHSLTRDQLICTIRKQRKAKFFFLKIILIYLLINNVHPLPMSQTLTQNQGQDQTDVSKMFVKFFAKTCNHTTICTMCAYQFAAVIFFIYQQIQQRHQMLGWFFPSKGELLHPRYLPKNRISLQPINKNGIRESVTTIFGICIYKDPPHSDLTFFLYFKCILFRPIGAKLTS